MSETKTLVQRFTEAELEGEALRKEDEQRAAAEAERKRQEEIEKVQPQVLVLLTTLAEGIREAARKREDTAVVFATERAHPIPVQEMTILAQELVRQLREGGLMIFWLPSDKYVEGWDMHMVRPSLTDGYVRHKNSQDVE